MRKKKLMRQLMAQGDAEAEQEWRRQEQQLQAELKRLLDIGTPRDLALEQAYGNLARPFTEAKFRRDESVRQELTVLYQVLPEHFEPAYLLVTDMGLIWSVAPRFESPVSLSYADVVSVSGGSMDSEDDSFSAKGLTITYRPRDFPTELRRFNPTGELDATFVFLDVLDQETARTSILARTGHAGAHDDDDKRHALERFRAASADVTTWTSCPMCCNDLDRPTPSVMLCRSGPNQRHMFCAPDTEPLIDESDDNFGAVVGEQRWMPLLESELELVGLPLIWLSWRDRPFGPPKILDYETIRAVWGKE